MHNEKTLMKKIVPLIIVSLLLVKMDTQLLAAMSANLNSVIAYPLPFDSSRNHNAITFDNLTAQFRIRIFTLKGQIVCDRTGETLDGTWAWNLRNDDGQAVAQGIYLYVVTNNAGQKYTGKLIVAR